MKFRDQNSTKIYTTDRLYLCLVILLPNSLFFWFAGCFTTIIVDDENKRGASHSSIIVYVSTEITGHLLTNNDIGNQDKGHFSCLKIFQVNETNEKATRR